MNEEVGISFKNFHENSLHDFVQDQFENVKRNVQFEQPSYGKQMTEFSKGCHVLYDPVAEHMNFFFIFFQLEWLVICLQKGSSPLSYLVAIMILPSDSNQA